MKTKTIFMDRLHILFWFLLITGGVAIMTYTPDMFAGKIDTICERQFIGYEYNPKYDRLCRYRGKIWTEQIKKSFNQR